MSQNSKNQGFSYYICLMIEGSGSGRPKNTWIRWIRIRIRIRNTDPHIQCCGYGKISLDPYYWIQIIVPEQDPTLKLGQEAVSNWQILYVHVSTKVRLLWGYVLYLYVIKDELFFFIVFSNKLEYTPAEKLWLLVSFLTLGRWFLFFEVVYDELFDLTVVVSSVLEPYPNDLLWCRSRL